MVLNEAKIQKLIFCEYAARAIVVPNAFFRSGRWEMDILVVMKSGLTYEFEIKCTKADFKNEFKKKAAKHRYMNANYAHHYHANYYSIVCPYQLLTVEDVSKLSPNYGLTEIGSGGYGWRPLKRPKKLHDGKMTPEEYRKLCIKLMYKLFNFSDKYKVRKKVL